MSESNVRSRERRSMSLLIFQIAQRVALCGLHQNGDTCNAGEKTERERCYADDKIIQQQIHDPHVSFERDVITERMVNSGSYVLACQNVA